ncbi:MAG TPA: glycerate kinase [Sphingomonas sp.]|uniref:glycerate kinase type-2 family protein n=1 Tax=Sphingomonas sp. TaxID=28214 RepID=UPI002CCA3AF1|nr:glycerate kinase [Sphingomonas sp.]HMI19583.1 glycerate kinase [Sphingomonas sp.]
MPEPISLPLPTPGEIAQRALLIELFDVAVAAVSADLCIPAQLPAPVPGRTLILAIGKAGAAMARAVYRHMEGTVDGIVLTRYGHSYPASQMPPGFTVFEAGHPLPDEHGIAATRHILDAVRALGPDDQLLALVSGGASALLTMPATGVTLADKQDVTRQLLQCGASISEINCVRTHLSGVKGGRLALAAAPAKVVTLVLSDIPGDDPALVGSGPTLPDRTKLEDARKILALYGIVTPDHVRDALADPANETPNASRSEFDAAETRVIARSINALQAAGQMAAAAGYTPVYLGGDIEGDSTEVGTIHAALALHHAQKGGRWALLSGGETTVVVRNADGRGGRNTEYLLSLALALDRTPGISALSCDTDGIDGTEDNAGALITPTTLARARRARLSPASALRANKTYDFFAGLEDLVVTGPTRTNVNDFRVILVDR